MLPQASASFGLLVEQIQNFKTLQTSMQLLPCGLLPLGCVGLKKFRADQIRLSERIHPRPTVYIWV